MCQLKNHLKFLIFGLLFVLAACSGAEASQPAPVREAPAEVKPEASPVETETVVEAAKGGDETPVTGEKPVVAKEEKPAGEEIMAASTDEKEIPTAEPAAVTEAMPEKTEITPEAAPRQEKAMTGPANTPSTGPTEAQLELLAGLESRGAPPELFSEVWLNSEPLKLADLRGKVVIVEFWTFG